MSGIDDFAADEDMAELMREVYVAFQSEVSGAESKAGAGKLMDLMSKLNTEAQGNTPVADLRNHAGAATLPVRALERIAKEGLLTYKMMLGRRHGLGERSKCPYLRCLIGTRPRPP